jgi:hypothetical protein
VRHQARALVLTAISVLALGVSGPAFAQPTPPPADSLPAGFPASVPPAAAALRAIEVSPTDGPAPVTLPHRVVRNSDGSVDVVADKAAVDALVSAAAASDACGNSCDGEDPASYLVKPPGGQSNWYYCSADAKTIHTKTVNDSTFAELRYSPRCRTAWTRGGYYSLLAGFSYKSNGTERERVTGPSAHEQGVSRYTAMLNDAGYTYKACVDGQTGGSPLWRCTAKY